MKYHVKYECLNSLLADKMNEYLSKKYGKYDDIHVYFVPNINDGISLHINGNIKIDIEMLRDILQYYEKIKGELNEKTFSLSNAKS